MFSNLCFFCAVCLLRKTCAFAILLLWWRLMVLRDFFGAHHREAKSNGSGTPWDAAPLWQQWNVLEQTHCINRNSDKMTSACLYNLWSWARDGITIDFNTQVLTSRVRHLKWTKMETVRITVLSSTLPTLIPPQKSVEIPPPPSANHPWNGTSVFHGTDSSAAGRAAKQKIKLYNDSSPIFLAEFYSELPYTNAIFPTPQYSWYIIWQLPFHHYTNTLDFPRFWVGRNPPTSGSTYISLSPKDCQKEMEKVEGNKPKTNKLMNVQQLVNHLPFQGNQPTLGYKFPSPVVSSRPSDWKRSTFKKETLAEILCEKPSQKAEKLGHLTVEA